MEPSQHGVPDGAADQRDLLAGGLAAALLLLAIRFGMALWLAIVIAVIDAGESWSRFANTSVYCVVPSSANRMKIAMARPTSPTRFIRNAFLAAVAADGRFVYQPISRYEARPTPSQPTKQTSSDRPSTSSSMKNRNRLRYAK